MLAAGTDQFSANTTSPADSPLKHIPMLWNGHIQIKPVSLLEQSYRFDFVRMQLPRSLGLGGLNRVFMAERPTVGRDFHSTYSLSLWESDQLSCSCVSGTRYAKCHHRFGQYFHEK